MAAKTLILFTRPKLYYLRFGMKIWYFFSSCKCLFIEKASFFVLNFGSYDTDMICLVMIYSLKPQRKIIFFLHCRVWRGFTFCNNFLLLSFFWSSRWLNKNGSFFVLNRYIVIALKNHLFFILNLNMIWITYEKFINKFI